MSSFVAQTLPVALARNHVGEDQPLAGFIDMQGVRDTVAALHAAFPSHFLHAFAAKANTMKPALELVRAAGMSCEVASVAELQQALNAGFEPDQVVYDEPAKLPKVLRTVLEKGIALNLDNFQEFSRVREIQQQITSTSRVGFRINPQVGAGSIGPMSTATASSKFGVALEDGGNRQRLVGCYASNNWLTSIHSHVGSQGVPLEKMVAGIRKITDLALEINQACGRKQVDLIDIGGGLPVNFDSDEVRPSFADFSGLLEREVPELFSGEFAVKTEYGRAIYAKNGFVATRIEYTKESGGRRIATSHAGAQVAARTVFMPEHWKIRLSAWDPQGRAKTGENVPQDIAGPLCFAGDMLGKGREMPLLEPGDLVVLHDTGAYYFSIPFFYNAMPACAVYGIDRADDGQLIVEEWRRQQTLEEALAVIG